MVKHSVILNQITILGWFPEVLRGGWGIYPTYTLNPLKSVKNPIICKSLIINQLENSSLSINELRIPPLKKLLNSLEIWILLRIFTYIKQTKGMGYPLNLQIKWQVLHKN